MRTMPEFAKGESAWASIEKDAKCEPGTRKQENAFLTYGGNGVRHMGKGGGVGEFKCEPRKTNAYIYR